MTLPFLADPLTAAREVAPAIRAVGDEIEEGRRLPSGIVEKMRRAGMFRLAVPRSYGGIEADPVTASRVIQEVSASDGSAGWCVMLAAQSGIYGGFMAPDAAREAFEPGGVFAGGSSAHRAGGAGGGWVLGLRARALRVRFVACLARHGGGADL